MNYIVGLGNPGDEYINTRHNLGWKVLDVACSTWRFPSPHNSSTYSGRVSEGVLDSHEVTVLYPETFMNNSGSAVAKILPKDKLTSLIVVYDDVDLAKGSFKISFDGGAGGHNGVSSIIESLGSGAFVRVRVGISPKHQETGAAVRPAADKLAGYVLAQISAHEAGEYDAIMKDVVDAIALCIKDGHEAAMSKFNI